MGCDEDYQNGYSHTCVAHTCLWCCFALLFWNVIIAFAAILFGVSTFCVGILFDIIVIVLIVIFIVVFGAAIIDVSAIGVALFGIVAIEQLLPLNCGISSFFSVHCVLGHCGLMQSLYLRYKRGAVCDTL